MALRTPRAVITKTTLDALDTYRGRIETWRNEDIDILDRDLTDETLANLAAAATAAEDKSFGRMITAIQKGRTGDFSGAVPKWAAAPSLIRDYILRDMIDGWVYRQEADGHLHPYLVTDIVIEKSRNNDDEYIVIKLVSNNSDGKLGVIRSSITLQKEDVTRKRIGDIFAAQKLFKETAELRATYDEEVARYQEVLSGGFAEQYRFTGVAGRSWKTEKRHNRKVIHDIAPGEVPAFAESAYSSLLDSALHTPAKRAEKGKDENASVPIRTLIRIFDLHSQEFTWVNALDLTEYEYDKTLREKLILPENHRELLDILTTDIDTFTGDIIEGKSTGNVILCKGTPGLGKTLTAEVYAELTERPLYAIHSGSLGINAETVRKKLEEVFARADRWNAVLLLDEADVFVIERGASIEQNAIVAEFLRVLEYQVALMFMTTNRAENIDDAILSRCAAIISYETPGADDAKRIWKVLADNIKLDLSDQLITELVDTFPKASPRDVKMLVRLVARISGARGEAPSVGLFRQAGMFRGM